MKSRTPAPRTSFLTEREFVDLVQVSVPFGVMGERASVCRFAAAVTSPSRSRAVYRPSRARPEVFKAYDVRGLYPDGARRGRRVRDRARVRRAVRAAADRGRSRHAPVVAVDGRGGDRGCRGRRRRRARPRAGRHRDGLFRGRRARARRRDRGHRVAQPEAVHGHEDRARAARFRSEASRACSTCATARVAARWRDATRGEIREEDIWDAFVERVLSFVDVDALRPLRIVIDAANGMAGAMLPPVLARLPMLDVVPVLLRAGRHRSRTTSRTRCCPRTASSSSPRRRARAPTSVSPTTATPTAASSSTTPASSFRATSRRRSSPRRSSRASRAAR